MQLKDCFSIINIKEFDLYIYFLLTCLGILGLFKYIIIKI